MAAAIVAFTCEKCGKVFTVREKELQHRTPKYCSQACNDSVKSGRILGTKKAKIAKKVCENCRYFFQPRTEQQKYCCRECLYEGKRGVLSPNWQGGRHVNTEGYVLVYLPQHPGSDTSGYVKEHRLVMEKHLGRFLQQGETVHHKRPDSKQDNSLENLQLRRGQHGSGQCFECADCGSRNIVALDL